MRVTNIIREKIDRELSKKLDAEIEELYADQEAYRDGIRAELEAVIKEANAKAREVLARHPEIQFKRFGDIRENYITDTAYINFPEDKELKKQETALRNKKRDLAMDLEIRCALEKDADKFFEMLANASF